MAHAAPGSLLNAPRSSGILLHPTSLPGPYGMGELGSAAEAFIDYLAATEQNLWQIMPLGPTGYGDSPYQSFSAFAGNPMLISMERLAKEGRLSPDELANCPNFPATHVDFGSVIEWRNAMLRLAYRQFTHTATGTERQALHAYAAQHSGWLPDFALFMALKERFSSAWSDWPKDIRTRQPEALAHWRQELADDIARHVYYQYEFNRQWSAVHAYAAKKGIRIIGDIPIFVAYDSADAWAHPEMFYFNVEGHPTEVAGVPPDYFSPTGQLWGNPLYRWDEMEAEGYTWWIERFRHTFEAVDIVRLDHFRGFIAYWSVPADEETAINGEWKPGPGPRLFSAVRAALGNLPIIAEDLGVITPAVEALREGEGFPGMKVLQFAFGTDSSNPYLPHNYERNCVVYTGTHDNDTSVGWFQASPAKEQAAVLDYTDAHGQAINWPLIRLALMSVARWAIFPMQDVIGAGSEARMNTPGQASGNWSWRLTRIPDGTAERLRRLTRLAGRGPHAEKLADDAAKAAALGVDIAASSKKKTQ
ncbi:MAG: 4-alpha-glucanotransferase [Anaerolineae bacterium]